MGLGIREWMIVIGILLLLAVLLDGLRRMRRERRDQLSVAAKMGGGRKHEDDDFPLATTESPKVGTERTEGGQRVEPSIDEEQAAEFFESVGAPVKAKKQKLAKAKVSGERHGKPAVSRDHAARQYSQKRAQQSVQKQVEQAPAKETPAEEIVIVNVLAKNEIGFNGADLLQILLACDMRFGKRKIFHRHEHKNGTGAIQFSMANAVEPGVFDLNNIEDFHTSGVTFFLSLPGPEDPIKAFDYMVETANCLVSNLSGELKDAEQCTMTGQTLEHHRQRVQEFERRQLAHSG